VREPSLRKTRSVRPDGVLMSKADRMKRFVLLLVAVVATALFGGACQSQNVGEMRHESRTIQPENAQSVRANLKMGAGELQVVGAADGLMEADFSYNVADWKPRVSYQVVGDTGELSVKQGSGGGVRLALTGLTLEMGAGRTTVDLTGDYKQDFDASIQGGVGEATVLLPSEVGVRAKAQGGLGKINAEGLQRKGGSYVNDAYGSSDVILDVDVQGGVGEINLKQV
jgi:hypothetical protein